MLSSICAALLGAAAVAASSAVPLRASLDAPLRAVVASGQRGSVRVIVRARPDRAGDLEAAIAAAEGTLLSRLEVIQAVAARVAVHRLPALQEHPAVASISSDGPVMPHAAPR